VTLSLSRQVRLVVQVQMLVISSVVSQTFRLLVPTLLPHLVYVNRMLLTALVSLEILLASLSLVPLPGPLKDNVRLKIHQHVHQQTVRGTNGVFFRVVAYPAEQELEQEPEPGSKRRTVDLLVMATRLSRYPANQLHVVLSIVMVPGPRGAPVEPVAVTLGPHFVPQIEPELLLQLFFLLVTEPVLPSPTPLSHSAVRTSALTKIAPEILLTDLASVMKILVIPSTNLLQKL
jgi:hypothetical protein